MKHIRLLFQLVLVAMLVFGCAPEATGPVEAPAESTAAPPIAVPATQSAEPRVLKIATGADFTTWDPSASFSTEVLYMSNMYEPLLYVNPAGAKEKYSPALAESWEYSEDGLTWTVHLRRGVKFHDGEEMDADAVIKSITRTMKLGKGAAFIWNPVESMKAPDDSTVVFKLKYAAPMELIAGATYGAWIYSPKAVDAATADPEYFQPGIEAGTGPYMLESFEPSKETILTKFEDYWRGWGDTAHFDKVMVSFVPDAVTQQQMVDSGQVDLGNVPMENIETQFKNNPNFTVVQASSPENYLAFLNTKRPPLDNKLVRQAIAYAIPYSDIITVGQMGFATQARGPVPQGIWPYSEQVFQYGQDLAKAKELMKEAGLEGKTFKLNLTYSSANQSHTRYAPLIKDALKEIGFEVELQGLKFSQQWKVAKENPATAQDIFLLKYWPSYSDAGTDNLYAMFHSEDTPYYNLGYYSNPAYDKLIDEAAKITITDPENAQALYTQAMNILTDDSPAVFLYDAAYIAVVPVYIGGYTYNINYPKTVFWYDLTKK